METEERRMQNGSMQRTNDLLDRTKQFALATIRFWEGLPKDETSRVLGRQLSALAHRLERTTAPPIGQSPKPSKADFISKMGTVLEEADESTYWIELLSDAGKVDASQSDPLYREANELVAIAVSSIKTARRTSQVYQ